MVTGSMAAAGFRAAALPLLCIACTSINATQASFEGTRWHVTSINNVPTPPYRVWPYRIWFSGGFMRGNICNRFEAPYRVTRDSIRLNGFMSTERGCSNPEASFEEQAFAILHQPMRMRWHSERRLTLDNRAGKIELQLEP